MTGGQAQATATIDAHHHFWRFDAAEYPWIDDEMGVLRQDYLPAALEATLRDTDVAGVLSVQARGSIAETDFLLEHARTMPLVRGVVGWAPLEDRRVGDILDRFIVDPRFKGVREVTQGQPDEAFFTNENFNRGLREVTRRRLTYDLLVYEDQLEAATRFVDRHPDQRFVLDHIGKPVIRRGGPAKRWSALIERLAERPHVACKFSGVVTEVRDPTWDPDLIRPYFEVVWNSFGADRVMFGSDWPVCLLRATYREWLDAVHLIVEPLPPAVQAAFFRQNAITWYRL
jgi:L-fuconolactonase